jgi:hypothetical protein
MGRQGEIVGRLCQTPFSGAAVHRTALQTEIRNPRHPRFKSLTAGERKIPIYASLPLGAFTAVLAGKNSGTGIGLVEIYNLH